MKRTILSLAFLLVFSGFGFAQSNGIGVGIMIGEPTGISAKYWLNSQNSINGGLAWSFAYKNTLYVHADYVWHNYNMINIQSGKLPVYYGVGVVLGLSNDTNHIGIRIPLGVDYQFASSPLDVFIEIAPQLNLTPSTSFGVGGAIGIRYFF